MIRKGWFDPEKIEEGQVISKTARNKYLKKDPNKSIKSGDPK